MTEYDEDAEYDEEVVTVEIRFRFLRDEGLGMSDGDVADLVYYQMDDCLNEDNDLSVAGVLVVQPILLEER